jgi:hypothetical protein
MAGECLFLSLVTNIQGLSKTISCTDAANTGSNQKMPTQYFMLVN